jgi:hypothetical protein
MSSNRKGLSLLLERLRIIISALKKSDLFRSSATVRCCVSKLVVSLITDLTSSWLVGGRCDFVGVEKCASSVANESWRYELFSLNHLRPNNALIRWNCMAQTKSTHGRFWNHCWRFWRLPPSRDRSSWLYWSHCIILLWTVIFCKPVTLIALKRS